MFTDIKLWNILSSMETDGELLRVRRINGFKLSLGSMPYSELMEVYIQAQTRAELAHSEADIVAEYMDVRFPVSPEPDAA